MDHCQANYSFRPGFLFPYQLEVKFSFPHQSSSEPTPLQQKHWWQWSYSFTDGSLLRGSFQGTLIMACGPDVCLPDFQVHQVGLTEYLTGDRQTVLLQWQPEQFSCFEIGQNLLLMASSDNYVGNSLCLVNSPQRQWAQITHWGSRLAAERLAWERFSLQCAETITTVTTWVWDWHFSPLVPPFVHWQLRTWPPKTLRRSPPLACDRSTAPVC